MVNVFKNAWKVLLSFSYLLLMITCVYLAGKIVHNAVLTLIFAKFANQDSFLKNMNVLNDALKVFKPCHRLT